MNIRLNLHRRKRLHSLFPGRANKNIKIVYIYSTIKLQFTHDTQFWSCTWFQAENLRNYGHSLVENACFFFSHESLSNSICRSNIVISNLSLGKCLLESFLIKLMGMSVRETGIEFRALHCHAHTLKLKRTAIYYHSSAVAWPNLTLASVFLAQGNVHFLYKSLDFKNHYEFSQ
jgi:hypothetical protein